MLATAAVLLATVPATLHLAHDDRGTFVQTVCARQACHLHLSVRARRQYVIRSRQLGLGQAMRVRVRHGDGWIRASVWQVGVGRVTREWHKR